MYRPAVSNKNGVVGSPGTTIPITPTKRDNVPSKINTDFKKLMNYFLLFVNLPMIWSLISSILKSGIALFLKYFSSILFNVSSL